MTLRKIVPVGLALVLLSMVTVSPARGDDYDQKTILTEVKRAGAMVTVEEHQMVGGLGGAIAELLGAYYPAPIEFVGVRDEFGQSGTPAELIEHYGLGTEAIIAAVKRVIGRRG